MWTDRFVSAVDGDGGHVKYSVEGGSSLFRLCGVGAFAHKKRGTADVRDTYVSVIYSSHLQYAQSVVLDHDDWSRLNSSNSCVGDGYECRLVFERYITLIDGAEPQTVS